MKKEIFKSFIVASLIVCAHIASATEPDCALMVDELGNAAFSGDVRIKGELVRSVPIGTVLDWYRPDTSFSLPSNFAICNGATITDPESPYYNKAVPNLLNRFIRGVTHVNNIGSSGGGKDLGEGAEPGKPFTTSGSGSHSHTLSGTTGSVSNVNNSSGTTSNYYVRDDSSGWTQNAHIAVDTGGNSAREGQHKHTLQGSTDSVSNHTHTVKVLISAEEMMPSYYGLLKIIRIK